MPSPAPPLHAAVRRCAAAPPPRRPPPPTPPRRRPHRPRRPPPPRPLSPARWPRPLPRVTTLDDVAARDPIAAYPAAPGRALPETRLLISALRYLDGPGATDRFFAALFWQYVRLRSLFYQHVTQAPETAGLDWFDSHYTRIGAVRQSLDAILFDGALRLDARFTLAASRGLGALKLVGDAR